MHTHADRIRESKNQMVSNDAFERQHDSEPLVQFMDNRPGSVTRLKSFQDMPNNNPEANRVHQFQAMADNYTSENRLTVQKKENKTGLPDNLKTGMENLSGISLDDVTVHYNSNKPAQLQAHAYAQGTNIHLSPGQDRHLPHEAWHVVQQKQGRVNPTMQMKGVSINNDAGLEKEADVMGAKALSKQNANKANSTLSDIPNNSATVQRTVNLNGETDPAAIWAQVGGLVTTRYKRKQLLFSWAVDGETHDYTDPQELADDLDLANKKGGRLGRARPDWAPNLTSVFSQTFGGSWHRRHIIMSSLMRNAVYSVTDSNPDHEEEVIETYNKLTEGLLPAADSLAQAEANLVYLLHNNPANLVIDEGSWNSAIGAYAHNVDQVIKKPHDEVFELYKTDSNAFLDQFVKGFQPGIQESINEFWKDYFEKNPFNSAEELVDTLEMMYDNAAVDLMTSQGMPQQDGLTAALLGLHGQFATAVTSGDLNTLTETCAIYIGLGVNTGARIGAKTITYANVM